MLAPMNYDPPPIERDAHHAVLASFGYLSAAARASGDELAFWRGVLSGMSAMAAAAVGADAVREYCTMLAEWARHFDADDKGRFQ